MGFSCTNIKFDTFLSICHWSKQLNRGVPEHVAKHKKSLCQMDLQCGMSRSKSLHFKTSEAMNLPNDKAKPCKISTQRHFMPTSPTMHR